MHTSTQHHYQQTFVITAIDSLSETLNKVTQNNSSNNSQQSNFTNKHNQWILLITPTKMPLKSLLRDKVNSLSRIIAITVEQIDNMTTFLEKVTQSSNFSSVILLQDTLTVATERGDSQPLLPKVNLPASAQQATKNRHSDILFYSHQNVQKIPESSLF